MTSTYGVHLLMTSAEIISPPQTRVLSVGTLEGSMIDATEGVQKVHSIRIALIAPATSLSLSSSLGMQTHPPKMRVPQISITAASKVSEAKWKARVPRFRCTAGPKALTLV